MRLLRSMILAAVALCAASPASADATAFLGTTTSPALAKGFAIGFGVLIVGFEFEFSDIGEDLADAAPALRTGMGNVLLQTPVPIFRVQPYFTTGAGGYREELGIRQETHFGVNTGGGAKVVLIGPIRARFDYRLFKLSGGPLQSTVHRFYAGINLNF